MTSKLLVVSKMLNMGGGGWGEWGTGPNFCRNARAQKMGIFKKCGKKDQNSMMIRGQSIRPISYKNGGQNQNPMKMGVRKIELGVKKGGLKPPNIPTCMLVHIGSIPPPPPPRCRMYTKWSWYHLLHTTYQLLVMYFRLQYQLIYWCMCMHTIIKCVRHITL